MKTTKKFYYVNKSEIGFIKFIFEAYEGIAVLSTVNNEKDMISVNIAPGCEKEVEELIAQLGKNVKMEHKV